MAQQLRTLLLHWLLLITGSLATPIPSEKRQSWTSMWSEEFRYMGCKPVIFVFARETIAPGNMVCFPPIVVAAVSDKHRASPLGQACQMDSRLTLGRTMLRHRESTISVLSKPTTLLVAVHQSASSRCRHSSRKLPLTVRSPASLRRATVRVQPLRIAPSKVSQRQSRAGLPGL